MAVGMRRGEAWFSMLMKALAAIALAVYAEETSTRCRVMVSAPHLDSPEALRSLGSIPPFSVNSTDSTAPALGAVIVDACVDAKGNLARNPQVAKSSGNSRLDAAALELAKILRYQPAMCDSKPMFACFQFKITFWPGPAVQS